MDCEHTVYKIQEADTDNPEATEAAAARALKNSENNLTHPNKVPQVINEALELYDDEYDDDFDDNDIIFDAIIDEANNTETQVNDEEYVEYK